MISLGLFSETFLEMILILELFCISCEGGAAVLVVVVTYGTWTRSVGERTFEAGTVLLLIMVVGCLECACTFKFKSEVLILGLGESLMICVISMWLLLEHLRLLLG